MSGQHIVVHAGFHKTGTTAIQSFLSDNGPHLWPHMALVLPGRIGPVSKCATLHSVMQDPLTLEEYHGRLTAFLQTLHLGKKRHLLISCEDLAGLIPGRGGHENYATCPVLLLATKVAIKDVFGPDMALSFYMCTRDQDAWLRSSYWQNLRVSKLKMDYDPYAATYRDAANFKSILAQAQTLLGDTPIVTRALEDTGALRFGPATPLIDLFPLPPDCLDALAPPQARNVSPDSALIAQMLAVNKSALSENDCFAHKKALFADYIAAQTQGNSGP